VLASLTRGDLSRVIRRHRRIVAAVLAGLATLLIANAVSHRATAPVSSSGPTLSQDEVALAITLETRAAANAVEPGDRVSVVAVSDDGFSSIVADGARVLKTASSGGFGASDAAVTLAVDEASALRLASASARGTLTVIIRPPIQ
jgi:Flp pilus assembly protein CpaB